MVSLLVVMMLPHLWFLASLSYPWSCGRGREEFDADDLDGDDVPEQDHNNQYTIAANLNFIYFLKLKRKAF